MFPDSSLIVIISQGALRPMPPPSIHPSASGLLPTPSMAVQIPTAKVTHPNAAQDCSAQGLKCWVTDGSCFPSPVSIPELSPERATSRLPLPQPGQPEVLSPRQIAHPQLRSLPRKPLGDRLDFISRNCLILLFYGRLQFHIICLKR